MIVKDPAENHARNAPPASHPGCDMISTNSFALCALLLAGVAGFALGSSPVEADNAAVPAVKPLAFAADMPSRDVVTNAIPRLDVGPPASDKLIRPFCKRLMAQAARGRTWSRQQIDRMDNGQMPDVFSTCGGFNCRHQWAVALEQE